MRKYRVYSTPSVPGWGIPLISDDPEGIVTFLQVEADLDSCFITGIEVSFMQSNENQKNVLLYLLQQSDAGVDGVTVTPVPLVVGDTPAASFALSAAYGVDTVTPDALYELEISPNATTFIHDFADEDFIEVPTGTRVGLSIYPPVGNETVDVQVSFIIGENE